MSNYVNNKSFLAKKITVPANSPVNIIGNTDSNSSTLAFATNCYNLTLINEGTEIIYFDFFHYGSSPVTIDVNSCIILPVGLTITLNMGVSSERVGATNPYFMTNTSSSILRTIQMIMNRS